MLKSLFCLIFALCFLPSQSVHPSQSLNFRFASVSARPDWQFAYGLRVDGCPEGQYQDIYVGDCTPSHLTRGNNMNVEHVVPRSWFTEPDESLEWLKWERFVTDPLHLFITRSRINNLRDSYPFGIVDTKQRYYGACNALKGGICLGNDSKTNRPFVKIQYDRGVVEKDGWKFGYCQIPFKDSDGKNIYPSDFSGSWTSITAFNYLNPLCFEPPKFSKPVIAAVMRKIHHKYFTSSMGKVFDAYLTEFAREFNAEVQKHKTTIEAQLEQLADLRYQARNFFESIPGLSKEFTDLKSKIEKVKSAVDDIQKNVHNSWKPFEELQKKVQDLGGFATEITKVKDKVVQAEAQAKSHKETQTEAKTGTQETQTQETQTEAETGSPNSSQTKHEKK